MEVVAATAMLTLIVAACVPLMQAARRDLALAAQSRQRVPSHSFERAVDELLTQRKRLVAELRERAGPLGARWQSGGAGYAAEVELLTTVVVGHDTQRSSHGWVVFREGDVETIRWVRLIPTVAEQVP